MSKPTSGDYCQTNVTDNGFHTQLRPPPGYDLKELLDATPDGSQCKGFAKGLIVYHSDTPGSLAALGKRLGSIIERWIEDGTPCGKTCEVTKQMSARIGNHHSIGCADCERVYINGDFAYRAWEKLK